MIKFFYNGLKVNGGKLVKFMSWERPASKKQEAGIAIHAKHYIPFPDEVHKEFAVENATDSQTDYFEQDHFFVGLSHPRYKEIRRDVIEAKERHFAKRQAGKVGKLQALAVKVDTSFVEAAKKAITDRKEADLKAKGLAVAAEYLKLYGPLKEVVEEVRGKPSMVFEKQIEGDPDEPEVVIRTYVDLYTSYDAVSRDDS